MGLKKLLPVWGEPGWLPRRMRRGVGTAYLVTEPPFLTSGHRVHTEWQHGNVKCKNEINVFKDRVAAATFCRTYRHDGKVSPSRKGWGEGKCTPTPFHSIYHHVQSWGQLYTSLISSLPLCTMFFRLYHLLSFTVLFCSFYIPLGLF